MSGLPSGLKAYPGDQVSRFRRRIPCQLDISRCLPFFQYAEVFQCPDADFADCKPVYCLYGMCGIASSVVEVVLPGCRSCGDFPSETCKIEWHRDGKVRCVGFCPIQTVSGVPGEVGVPVYGKESEIIACMRFESVHGIAVAVVEVACASVKPVVSDGWMLAFPRSWPLQT